MDSGSLHFCDPALRLSDLEQGRDEIRDRICDKMYPMGGSPTQRARIGAMLSALTEILAEKRPNPIEDIDALALTTGEHE